MSNEEVERTLLTREFSVEFTELGDGRTLETRIMPYNTAATVSDPDTGPYQELFLPGAFERQTNAANRVEVLLNFEHMQGPAGIVGHGVELRDSEDALYGKFRMHDTPDGDKALHLVREGVLTGLSAEFYSLRARTVGGVTERIRAHLDKVSLCRPGLSAYKQAEVLAVRTEAIALEPVDLNPDLAERLERVGFEPLLRRAIVRRPWDGAVSRFEDEEWKRSCLLDRGASFDTAKTRYALPVLEPNGDLNVNGMHAAASRINQVQGSGKATAARKLVRYYRQAGEEPPASVLAAAAR